MANEWWKKSVVYQIYPISFNDTTGNGKGDIPGIIEKLDYLKELGIDVVWLSPIYDSPQADNGYDIRDYQSIYEQYGTMENVERLIEELHSRGMKLVMDLVVNHTSDEHQWFIESRSSKDNDYRDYYIWQDGKENGEPPTNWGSIFSGSSWEYDEQTEQYYLHLFAKKQPDLNWENPKLREDVYNMMKFWLDKGIDGFRMDVINFISKDQEFKDGEIKPGEKFGDPGPYFVNGPRIHEFLQEMNEEVMSKYDIMTVGEMPGASPEDAIEYTNPANHELDMIFTFEHMGLDEKNGDKWNLKPLDLVDLKENFEKWQISLHGVGWNSLYWNNHDQPRIVSRFGDDETYRVKSAKMLATCLHMMQGTPYIYQGEELGMTNIRLDHLEYYRDIETLNMYKEKSDLDWSHDRIMEAIYAKGRDNARTPMQWSNQKNAGFTNGTPWLQVNSNYETINAEAALADEDSIFYYYQHLIQLRKEFDVITTGTFELLMRNDPNVFAYRRVGQDESLIVLCNFSSMEVELDEKVVEAIQEASVLITNENKSSATGTLSPYEGTVFKH
ncbi:alpha,alpha-phosphotrehalase [Pontibacillus yanchengensis]|uniref:Alpha,alpha-phosphotrehalase n=1 Tax=Pontibacillus yanchengensis TaxID=462910 RepID=A0ACC7VCN5_9BACI|nr:alpha-glucosidase [Pontibacillus yanchengensis]MYL52751.1 alpha,alpha-phosphotrehalase [Pontibacillus yanchengensis]